jgi:hypothetical protein
MLSNGMPYHSMSCHAILCDAFPLLGSKEALETYLKEDTKFKLIKHTLGRHNISIMFKPKVKIQHFIFFVIYEWAK